MLAAPARARYALFGSTRSGFTFVPSASIEPDIELNLAISVSPGLKRFVASAKTDRDLELSS
jgi:hypothetical protein